METIGSLVDKISIVNLKIYHTEDVAHNPESTLEEVGKAKLKINVLNNQRNTLVEELDTMIFEVATGKRKVPKPFAQLKDYGNKKV